MRSSRRGQRLRASRLPDPRVADRLASATSASVVDLEVDDVHARCSVTSAIELDSSSVGSTDVAARSAASAADAVGERAVRRRQARGGAARAATTRASPSPARSVTCSLKISLATIFSSPRGRDERLPLLGKSLALCDVELVLVAQAAHEPPAGAGDLRRVEREALVLGHAELTGRSSGSQLRGAELAAAAPDAVQSLRFVAHADLPHLDRARGTVAARSRTSSRKSTRFSAVK